MDNSLDFYFLISDYEVEFFVPEYCDRVVIFYQQLKALFPGLQNNTLSSKIIKSLGPFSQALERTGSLTFKYPFKHCF